MATITFDQAGLTPPGITNRSRSDGLINGAKVTITLDEAGTVTFVDVPEGDVSSLTQESPLVWSFTPTAGIYGSWLVELQPLAAGDPVRRVFAVRTPGKGLRIPAFNERASSKATVADGASFIDASDDNEGESYRGWARSLTELFRTADITRGGDPRINIHDFGATGDNVTNDLPAINAAIAACPDRGEVYFPAYRPDGTLATYYVSTGIVIGGITAKSVSLTGGGEQKPVLRANDNAAVIKIVPTVELGHNARFTVRGLLLKGGKYGLHIAGSGDQDRIEDLRIEATAATEAAFYIAPDPLVEPVGSWLGSWTSRGISDITILGGQYGIRVLGDQTIANTTWRNIYIGYTTKYCISLEHGYHADGQQSTTSNITFGPFITCEGNLGSVLFNRNCNVALRSLHLENNGYSEEGEQPTFVLDGSYNTGMGVGSGARLYLDRGAFGGFDVGTNRRVVCLNQGMGVYARDFEWRPTTEFTTFDCGGFGSIRFECDGYDTLTMVNKHPEAPNYGATYAWDGSMLTVNQLRLGALDAINADAGSGPVIRAIANAAELFSGGVDHPRGSIAIQAPSGDQVGLIYRRWRDTSNGAALNSGWYAWCDMPEGRVILGETGGPQITLYNLAVFPFAPNVGGGIDIAAPAVGFRINAGVTEIWAKTGPAAPNWTKVALVGDLFTANKIQESGGPATLDVSTIPVSGVLRRNSSSQIVGGPVLVDNAGNISGAGTVNGMNLTGTTTPAAEAIGSVGAPGGATSYARSDHQHGMPGLATTSIDGFMPATSASKLAGISDGADVTLTTLSTAAVDIAVNNRKITGLANPTNALDAATKGYADAVTQGLDVKPSCRVIATTNITLSGTQTIDGVAVAAGNRVLCAGQTAGATNGIYVVAAGAWTRAADADTSADVSSGMFTFVVEGTSNADSGWVLITLDPIVLDTTPLVFTQFSGAGQIQAGTGLTKAGNTLNVGANADGSIVVAADDLKVGVLATDAQHGTRGGGTQHAAVTTSVDGFMAATDKVKLDGIATGAAALTVAGTPTQISVTTATVGSGTAAAKSDHTHSVSTATPISLSVGGANTPGTATSLVRSDHTHGLPAFGTAAGTFCEGNDPRLVDATIADRAPKISQCRLNGTNADSVMTANNGAISTIYLVPHTGETIYLFESTLAKWIPYAIPNAGISIALSSMVPNLVHDVFCSVSGVNGTPVLSVLEWSSNTTRATALARVNGVLVRSGNTARRYVGSIRARTASTIAWVNAGTENTSAKCDLWNADNRILGAFGYVRTVGQGGISGINVVQLACNPGSQFDFVQGLQACGYVTATVSATIQSRNTYNSVAIGYDSITDLGGGSAAVSRVQQVDGDDFANAVATRAVNPTPGAHYLSFLLHGNSATTVFGNTGDICSYMSVNFEY